MEQKRNLLPHFQRKTEQECSGMLGSAKWSYSPHKAAECIPIGFLPSTGHPVHLFIQQIFSELLPCARHYSRHWGNRCEPHRQNFMLSLGLPPSKTFNSIKKILISILELLIESFLHVSTVYQALEITYIINIVSLI